MAQETQHENRTAKIVEIVATSSKSFEDAVASGLNDAAKSIRNITGAEVNTMTVKCSDDGITEYRVALKLAFGIER